MTHMNMMSLSMDNLEELLIWIENHKNDLEEQLSLEDGADSICNYLEGAIECMEVILMKGQALVKH